MKKLLLAIFCLSIINISYSQNADAEYYKIHKEYTLNEDGSIEFHYAKELKLLSHYSFHRLYGETFIIYNTDFQTLKINSAYTIMADGKKTITPENAFNEVLPRFSTNAPSFNNIREMVVTHTGLEVGSTINLDYTINSKKGFFPALMIDDVLSESSPIQELIIKVNIPDSKNLHFELLNLDGDPTITTEKGKKVYIWTFKSIPANSKDYYQLSDQLDAPRLIISTAKDMKFAYNQFVNQQAFTLKTNESMDKVVATISSENTDELSIALALQKLVSSNLGTLNIPLKYTGFNCRTAIETWNSNQGTNLEKTLLLTTLLQKADINAEPVVIIPNAFFNEEIGNLSFNDFLVRMKLQDYGEVFISADHINKQNLKFEISNKTILALDKNLESLKVYSSEKMTNKIFVNGDFDFKKPDRLIAKMYLILEANANLYFTLFNDSTSIKSVVKGGISSKDFISFNNVQLTQEMCSSHIEIEKDKPFKKFNSYMSFEIPFISNGVDSWHINLLTNERTSALEIPENIHERYNYTVVFIDDLKLVTEPINIEIKNDAGYLLIKFEKSEDKLIITREIKFDKKTIEINMYNDFKDIMDAWNNTNYKKIIFKK